MVGRFNVRSGDGDHDWMVWDDALKGGGCSSRSGESCSANCSAPVVVAGYGWRDLIGLIE
jgi:hypothetical protein